eukprot:5268342-Lingulodinium_polyedra.AAC.1
MANTRLRSVKLFKNRPDVRRAHYIARRAQNSMRTASATARCECDACFGVYDTTSQSRMFYTTWRIFRNVSRCAL